MNTNMSREQLHQALERKERQYAKLSKRVEYLRDRAAMADRLYKELDRVRGTIQRTTLRSWFPNSRRWDGLWL